jgi:tRNA dimethylallyltransferase
MPPDVTAGRACCWALIGPTASGKSALALELARTAPGGVPVEIVSVDSMQVYRGMDVGTAKPTAAERALVPHHMIDVLEPEEPCNVGRFRRMALEAIDGIVARGHQPLLVGGTALYLKGLVWGLAEAPGRQPEVRRRLERELEEHGSARLHERLARLDPAAAARIHPNDVQRLVRALEVCEATGRPASEGRMQFAAEPGLCTAMVGLRLQKEELYRRIDERVDRMMDNGLLEEVVKLRGRLGLQAGQALGYKELTEHVQGRMTLAEAVALVKRNTRRFAKHQLTWFRHMPHIRWMDAPEEGLFRPAAARCESLLRRA